MPTLAGTMVLKSQGVLLLEVRRALGMSQKDFGYASGASQRTAARWDAGTAHPAPSHWADIAKLVHPLDRGLAAEAAVHANQTLASLGLEAPPVAAAALAPRVAAETLVGVMVLAAVESGAPLSHARRWLHAALERGCAAGLTMHEAEAALRLPPVSPDRS